MIYVLPFVWILFLLRTFSTSGQILWNINSPTAIAATWFVSFLCLPYILLSLSSYIPRPISVCLSIYFSIVCFSSISNIAGQDDIVYATNAFLVVVFSLSLAGRITLIFSRNLFFISITTILLSVVVAASYFNSVFSYVHAPLIFSFLLVGYLSSNINSLYYRARKSLLLISSYSLFLATFMAIFYGSRAILLAIICSFALLILLFFLQCSSYGKKFLLLFAKRFNNTAMYFFLFTVMILFLLIIDYSVLSLSFDNIYTTFMFARTHGGTLEALPELRIGALSSFIEKFQYIDAKDILFGWKKITDPIGFYGLTGYHNSFLDSLSSYGLIAAIMSLLVPIACLNFLFNFLKKYILLIRNSKLSLDTLSLGVFSIACPLSCLFIYFSANILSSAVILSPYLIFIIDLQCRPSIR